MGQGESLAASAHNLAERQAVGRSAGDGESGQKDARSGRRELGHSGEEDGCSRYVARSRVSSSAVAAYLYPEVERQAASAGHPHDEGPGHAGTSPACARSGGGDHGGRRLVWISPEAPLCGRDDWVPLHLDVAAASPWVLEGDIRGCFDNISHDWLLAHVPMDRAILRKWLKAGYMEKQVLACDRSRGRHRAGSSRRCWLTSPSTVWSGACGSDTRCAAKDRRRGARPGVHLIRYADDFIITGRSQGRAGG